MWASGDDCVDGCGDCGCGDDSRRVARWEPYFSYGGGHGNCMGVKVTIWAWLSLYGRGSDSLGHDIDNMTYKAVVRADLKAMDAERAN